MDAEAFPSGDEFLASMQTRQPDCVVLDLHMPTTNGFDVLSRLAQSGMQVPVLTITGHDTPESRARSLAGGAAMYLLKPVDDVTLLDAIAAAIASAET